MAVSLKTIIITAGVASVLSWGITSVLAGNARYNDRQDAIEQGYRIASDSVVHARCQERPNHLCQAFVLIERRGRDNTVDYVDTYRIRGGPVERRRYDVTERSWLPADCTAFTPSTYWPNSAAAGPSGATCTWVWPEDPRYQRLLQDF